MFKIDNMMDDDADIFVMLVDKKLSTDDFSNENFNNLNILIQSCLDDELRKNLDLYVTEEDFEFLAKRIIDTIKEYGHIELGFQEKKEGEMELTKKSFHIVGNFPETMQEFMEEELPVVYKTLTDVTKRTQKRLAGLGAKQNNIKIIQHQVTAPPKARHTIPLEEDNSDELKMTKKYLETGVKLTAQVKDDFKNGKMSKKDHDIVSKYCHDYYYLAGGVDFLKTRLEVFGKSDVLQTHLDLIKSEIDNAEKIVKDYNDVFIKAQIEDGGSNVMEKVEKFKEDFQKENGKSIENFLNEVFKNKRSFEQESRDALITLKRQEKTLKSIGKIQKSFEKLAKSLTEEQRKLVETYLTPTTDWSGELKEQEVQYKIKKDEMQGVISLFEEQDKRFGKIKTNHKATEDRIKIYAETEKASRVVSEKKPFAETFVEE